MSLTIHPLSFNKMPPKKKPLPLHVSQQRINEERRNVEKRTQLRIAQLHFKEKMPTAKKQCVQVVHILAVLIV
jgi:hypothetical protein